jgi:hypothetical protein
MPKYTVLSPLLRNGERHEVNAEVEMSAKDAEPLLGHTLVLKAAAAAPDTGPTDPAKRAATVKAAIAKLDKDDKNAWMKDGRPNLDALSAAAVFRVTAAERDQALAELQPGGNQGGANTRQV